MKGSSSESKPFQRWNSWQSQAGRTAKPFQVQIAVLNWFRCRTFHVLNSRYYVRLMKSSASELGLTIYGLFRLSQYSPECIPVSVSMNLSVALPSSWDAILLNNRLHPSPGTPSHYPFTYNRGEGGRQIPCHETMRQSSFAFHESQICFS